MFEWSLRTRAQSTTIDIGYAGWIVLMAGAIMFLRAVGRGRCGWEPLTVVLLACLPPVWTAIQTIFHPEDLVAMGFVLGAVACVLRRWWAWAGVLIALAVLSQQFALLVAAPLFVIAPSDRRLRYSAAGILTASFVVVPLLTLGSGRALRAITLGSGDSSGSGGTLVRELHIQGWLETGVSRVLPILLSMALAGWLIRRLGSKTVSSPLPLIALVALSLSLRLVFEENLRNTYYFMALAVALVLLDVVRGHIRGAVLAWIALVTVAHDIWPVDMFSSVPWGLGATDHLPQVLMVIGIVVVLADVARGRVRWYLVAWTVLLIAAFATWPFAHEAVRTPLPIWLWQLILVSTGIWLAAGPLVRFIRDRDELRARDTTPLTVGLDSTRVPTTFTSSG
ncbi:MAG: hypothetical protein ACLPYY_08230 [Acidimicrobiales bacterium]